MNEIIVITILSAISLLLLIGNIMQYNNAFDLRNEVRGANEAVLRKEEEVRRKIKSLDDEIKSTQGMRDKFLGIKPGDRGILPNYSIVTTYSDNSQPKRNYTVTFEVEVIEVSDKRLKVKAIDYISGDAYANDPANKNSILNVINIKSSWVDRKDLELIVDDAKRRGDKIDQILND